MEKIKERIIVLLVINITNLLLYLLYIISRLSGFNLIRDGIYILLLSLLLINTAKILLLKKEENISSNIKWIKVQSIILFFLYSTDYLGSLYIIAFINWQIKFLFIYPYSIGIIITAINIIIIQYIKQQIRNQIGLSSVEKLNINNLKNLINKKEFSKYVSSLIRKGIGDGIGIGSLLHLLYNKEKIKIPFSLYTLKKPGRKKSIKDLLFTLFNRRNIKARYTLIKEKLAKAGTKVGRGTGSLILILFNRRNIKAWYTLIKEKTIGTSIKIGRGAKSIFFTLFSRKNIKAWYSLIKGKTIETGAKIRRGTSSLFYNLFKRNNINAMLIFIKKKVTKIDAKIGAASLDFILLIKKKMKNFYSFIKVKLFKIKKFHYPLFDEEGEKESNSK